MFVYVSLLVFGFLLLVKGADYLVEGSSFLAEKFGISHLVIGLTVVAFGTSAPELIVSALAALKGSTGIALGNIIGSNISNTLLILGVSAIIRPLWVKKTTVNKEIPLSLLAIAAVAFLVNDHIIDGAPFSVLGRADGMVLILFFAIFVYYVFAISKSDETMIDALAVEGGVKKLKNWQAYLMVLIGLGGLFVGGELVVSSAKNIAITIGLSEAFVGLTLVAIGTSLPELAASAMAAYKGKTDIAVGNVIGSNIFNLFWVLGISSIIKPISFFEYLNTDFVILFVITILMLFFVFVGKKNIIGKREGIVLVFLYFVYTAFLIYRG